MPKFLLGFLAGIVAFIATLGAMFGLNFFTVFLDLLLLEEELDAPPPPADLAELMSYKFSPWNPHGDKLSLFFNPDEIPFTGGQTWPMVIHKIQPVKPLDVVDFDRICIANIYENRVTYGFELWEETQDALVQEFKADLDQRRSEWGEPSTVYILDSLRTRIGQIRMDDGLLKEYQSKLQNNRNGLDFTIVMDMDLVYWFQPTIARFSDEPVRACDDTLDLDRFPTYWALIRQFWEVDEPANIVR